MTVVLVPGIGCAPWQFREIVPGLAPEPVLGLDLPGHGSAPAVAPVTLEAVADRLAEQVPPGSLLVGHSTGGVAGLVAAVRHPELLSGLVLLDANLPVTPEALSRKTSRAEAVLGPMWRRTLETSMRSSWGTREPALGEEVVAGILATDPDAVRPLWHAVLALDPRPLLAALRVPTLYLRSSRDVDPAALAALNPRIEAVDLGPAGAGHWPHLTAPGAVLAALGRFRR
ncbi:alpha/beta fold hydrolase [Kineococcus sp. LSe6-4]|uniref:Alpha/beta fold hydrolase n=1 Tax=Kineococcus halophytocola TaxID=3234027 RepID=A0ABV4H447_9ACTN